MLKALLVGGLLLAGCASKDKTSMQAPPVDPNPDPQITSDVRDRVKELVQRSDEYSAGAARLPGRDEMTDRQQVARQFELLSQILPALNGPEMTGDFRQALRIIESTRSLLAGSSTELSAEPTIDTGLRAAHRALSLIARQQFSDVADAGKSLDAMSHRLQELDTITGPIHRLVAAQAIVASGEAIGQMVNALDQRLHDKGGAAAKPAPAPTQTETPKPTTPEPAKSEAPKPDPAKTESPAPTPAPTPEKPKPEEKKPEPAKPALPELNK
jgi:hypothetical protein